MLWDALKENLVKPTGTRIGTLVTGALLHYGATEPQATAIGVGVGSALFFGADLMLAWLRKRSIVNKTIQQVAADTVAGGR